MEKLFEGSSVQLFFDAEKSMIVLKWLSQTTHWKNEDFVRENLNIVNFVARCKPTYLLSLSTNFLYIINPDEQLWLVSNVFEPHYKNGVKKMALIISKDFLSGLSIEQLIDETTIVPVGLFENQEEAEKWLFSTK